MAANPTETARLHDPIQGTTVAGRDVEAIRTAVHEDPFAILGPHEVSANGERGIAIRAFLPGVRNAWVLESGMTVPMKRVHPDGFFEAFFADRPHIFLYRLRIESEMEVIETEDPYAFPSRLSDFDLHLLGEGTHYRNFERLGAHACQFSGVSGVHFAVWAPNARRVSVVGDFNQWDGRRHPLRRHPGVGVWDIFIPGVDVGAKYKFELLGPRGELLPLKSDPYGFAFENRPRTASIVHDLHRYAWCDDEWMRSRSRHNALDAPISVYEVHLGSWIRDPAHPHEFLGYRELSHKLVEYVQRMGFTHIQLLPVSEHPFDGSWGYQPLGYFAPTSRYGSPEDFMYFVDHCHQHDIGVLVDWVPAHFPRDDHGLGWFDGTALYEHMDPRQGEHPDWGTKVFNYGRNEVANYLLGNALFWFETYHIDGIRVDAVASMLYLDYGRRQGEWVPNRYGSNENLEAVDFIKRLNELVHGNYPGVLTIAEESTAWTGVSRPTYLGGLGFSLKWNMGWMNDTLRYMHRETIHRKYHQNDLTFSLIYAFSENFMLPLSHDEVVHGKGSLLDKMPGDVWQKFANLRLLLSYFMTHPGKKLLFMGGEFGQWSEWRHSHSLDWHLAEYAPHQGVRQLVADLNRMLRNEASLYQIDFEYTGFQWIDCHDAESSVLAFVRRAKDPGDYVVVISNFTPVVREDYQVGVPQHGFYREVFNSDSELYGGSNVGNSGGVLARNDPCHGHEQSLRITMPPLATLVFKLERH